MTTQSKYRGSIATLIATFVLALAGAEMSLRVLQPVPMSDLLPYAAPRLMQPPDATPDAYVRFDAELGWSIGRSARTVDDGILLRSNAGGFRAEREYDYEPPLGVRRVAAFGDSFVHCDEVSYEECWTNHLEQSWTGTEALNFGIPGGAPDQGWLRYDRDGRTYDPCAVLIGFQVENVNRVVNRFRPFYAPRGGIPLSKPRFVLEGDGLRLLPNPVNSPAMLNDPRWVEQNLGPDDFWYFSGMFAPQAFDDFVLARLVRTAFYNQHRMRLKEQANEHPNSRAYRADDERFKVTGRVLIQFAHDVETSGATPVVVIFGQKADVTSARHREPKAYQPLLDWLKAEHVATIDVTDDLAREANRRGVDPLFARGGHYSRQGNEVVGRAISSKLPQLVAATCP
jgi:hypothetical protein